jgi:Tfp pilus assembly protein PilF
MSGRPADAIEILERIPATVGDADKIRITAFQADLYCRTGARDLFDARLRELTAMAGAEVMARRIRMRCLATQREFDALELLLTTLISEHVDNVEIVIEGLGLLLSSGDQAQYRQALGIYDKLIAASPDEVRAHLGKAQVAAALGEIDPMIDAYRGVLALEPDNVTALNDLAWVLADDKGELEEARQLADRGFALNSTDAHLLDTRGMILLKQGEFDLAAADLRRAILFAEDQPRTAAAAMIRLAEVLIKLGQPAKAAEQLDAAERLDTRHENRLLTEEKKARIAELRKST